MERTKLNATISGEANEVIDNHKVKNGFKYKEDALDDILLKFKKMCGDNGGTSH